MTSKKTAASKRASLPLAADYAKPFLKDWERLSRAGRCDMNLLKEAMLLLIANDVLLGAEWLDHPLGGDWQGHRECHIGGDFLLVYRVDDGSKRDLIVFVRTGTHADIFE
jgi:mRNA interferase YafQ